MSPNYTLTVCLISVSRSQLLDDVAEMFIKRMLNIHHKAKAALEQYQADHQEHADNLILTLREVVTAYQTEGTIEDSFSKVDAVLGSRCEQVLTDCEAHVSHAGNNYFSFLWPFYKRHRATLFHLIKVVKFHCASADKALEEAFHFLVDNEAKRGDWLSTLSPTNLMAPPKQLDLSWTPPGWWRLVTGQRNREAYPEQLNRRHFEVCLFSQIMSELESADLYVAGNSQYADYRDQLIPLEQYDKEVAAYGEMLGFTQ